MQVSLLTLETILRLFKATSNDETRPFLQAVNIKFNPDSNDGIILQATNGFLANETKIIDVEFHNTLKEFYPNGLLIKNDIEKELKSALTKFKKKFKRPSYIFQIDSRLIVTFDDKVIIQLENLERDFPKLENAIGNLEIKDDNFKIAFSLDVLKKLVDSMQINEKSKVIIMNFSKDDILKKDTCFIKPFIVSSTNDKVNQKAVLMPCKV